MLAKENIKIKSKRFSTPQKEQALGVVLSRIAAVIKSTPTETTPQRGEIQLRKTGIELIGNVPWGTHLCQFYKTKEDLIDILVPYFKAGLQNNELCMWVTSEPLGCEDAKMALAEEVKNLDECIEKGQIEIIDYSQWYTRSGYFESVRVLDSWVRKEKQALEKGFAGLRITGNTFWLDKKYWRDFAKYEAVVNSVIGKYRMLAVCTYSLDKCAGPEIIDIVNNHQMALIKQNGKWEIIESSSYRQAIETLRKSKEQYRNLLESISYGVQEVDRSGRIIFANKTLHKIYGYAEGELIGKEIFDFMVPKTQRGKLRAYLEDLGKGLLLPMPYEAKGLTKDGRVIDVLVHWSCKRDEYKCVTGFITVVADITDRKRLEEDLRSSQERFRVIADYTYDWESWHGIDGKPLWVNPAVERLTGYSVAECMAMPDYPLPLIYENDRADIAKALREAIDKCTSDDDLPFRIQHKNGTIREVVVSWQPIYNTEKTYIGIRSSG